MKIGMGLIAQNYSDWDRYEAMEQGGPAEGGQKISDGQVLQEQFYLGKLAEPLGFDSIWAVEHHFTPYTMINNPLQFLSYFAGCTERVALGTMVVVLPWHDPIRVAEEIVTLDHMLAGRELKVGLGRGLAVREFDGFGVSMEDTRERFAESLDIIRAGFRHEWFEYDGKFRKVPRTSLRPTPRSREDLLSSLYCAWGSPASMPIAANAGLRPLFVPARDWASYGGELAEFNRIRAEHGWEPERATLACWIYCAETEDQARVDAHAYLPEYGRSTDLHYQFTGEHLQTTKSYEYYKAMGDKIKELESPYEQLYLNNQIWGTPAQCAEKLRLLNETMGGVAEFIFVFSYGSMPIEKAETSARLFATEVMPELAKFEEVPAAIAG